MSALLREITVLNLNQKIQAGEQFTILDVREPWELKLAQITDSRLVHLPMSQISQQLNEAFPETLRDQQTEIVVMCHHGVRSANVAIWMTQNGWKNVSSLAGGIAAYAEEIDPSIGEY